MRTRIEKAIALIRQGHSAQAIEILESVCEELPYKKEEAEEQLETLELENVAKIEVQIPSFHINVFGDNTPEIRIDDRRWDFDANWMDHFVSQMREEYEHYEDSKNSEELVKIARELLTTAVQQGKVWRR